MSQERLEACAEVMFALEELLDSRGCPKKDQKTFVASKGYCLDCVSELDKCSCVQGGEDKGEDHVAEKTDESIKAKDNE